MCITLRRKVIMNKFLLLLISTSLIVDVSMAAPTGKSGNKGGSKGGKIESERSTEKRNSAKGATNNATSRSETKVSAKNKDLANTIVANSRGSLNSVNDLVFLDGAAKKAGVLEVASKLTERLAELKENEINHEVIVQSLRLIEAKAKNKESLSREAIKELTELMNFLKNQVLKQATAENSQWTNTQLANLKSFLQHVEVGLNAGKSLKEIVDGWKALDPENNFNWKEFLERCKQ